MGTGNPILKGKKLKSEKMKCFAQGHPARTCGVRVNPSLNPEPLGFPFSRAGVFRLGAKEFQGCIGVFPGGNMNKGNLGQGECHRQKYGGVKWPGVLRDVLWVEFRVHEW